MKIVSGMQGTWNQEKSSENKMKKIPREKHTHRNKTRKTGRKQVKKQEVKKANSPVEAPGKMVLEIRNKEKRVCDGKMYKSVIRWKSFFFPPVSLSAESQHMKVPGDTSTYVQRSEHFSLPLQ